MAYEYDVFISYHCERCGAWVRNHFHRFLDLALEHQLGTRPRIFLDRSIEMGDPWPRTLVRALATSKCMVAVWSPSYFKSKWCMYECTTILQRAEHAGGRRLLVPVVVSDGHGFPAWAVAIQRLDLTDYFWEGKGFEESPLYLEFQRVIRENAAGIAAAIQAAPTWRRSWLNRPDLQLPEPPSPVIPPPFLE